MIIFYLLCGRLEVALMNANEVCGYDLIILFTNTKVDCKRIGQHNSSSKNKSGSKSHLSDPQTKGMKMSAPKEDDRGEEDEEEDEQGGTLCGACGDNDGTDEF